MLTSIGRVAIRRLAATSYRRIAITQPRVNANGPLYQLDLSQPSLNVARGFASRGASKATTTAAAKKPQKTTAAKKATGVKAKKTTAKPAAKTKAKAKAKPTAKATAKPRAAKKKKPLSDKAKGILERKQLHQTAMYTEPKHHPETIWQVYVAQTTKDTTRATGPGKLQERMQQIAAAYKSLSSSEIRQLEQTAEQNKLNNAAAYKSWVETHTPPQVVAANNARQLLKNKYNIPKGHVKLITDERLPRRPRTAYILFTKARWSSGDFSGHITKAVPLIADEWKKLPEAEKKPYLDLSKADYDRYEKEVKSVLGRDLAPTKSEVLAKL